MGSHQPSFRTRFFLYPEPIVAPQLPYTHDDTPLSSYRGWPLVPAAFLMEWFGPLRRHSYQIAGFSSLRNIRHYIEHTEPRVNPAVYPLANGSTAAVEGQRSLSRPPKGTSDISPLWHSAADYRQLFLSAEITPLDVVNAILPLIRRDTVPPGEHSTAWFDVKVDIVIEAAKASTARYREKKSLGPLDGVPTAIKEEFDMEGYITTMGSVNDYTGQKLNEKGNIDNWCVQKLKEAGAVIVGKLSMHEFGMDTSGNNILFGTPRNPYNQDYYTGGSSSGSAYAVATGLVPMALGSDGGGSIRIPASCCSVFGLKTTHARMCSLPGENHSNSVSVDGPIAADVQSLAAMYAVISQPHPTSPFTQAPMFQSLEQDGQRPKVLGLPEVWFRRAKPEIQSLCRSMMDWLVAHKGYTVVPIQIPFVAEGQTAHALTILTDAATLLPDPRGLSPGNRVLLALGREIPATDYLLAQKLRNVLMQHLSSLWQTHPGMVIVTPTTACAGWPIGSEAELRYGMSDGVRTKQTMEYVWLANLCGVPSITVPAGFVKAERSGRAGEVAGGKVPVGLMATGEWASEESLLQFGLDAEEAGVGLQRRPPTWVDVVHRAREGGDADEAP